MEEREKGREGERALPVVVPVAALSHGLMISDLSQFHATLAPSARYLKCIPVSV